MRTKLFLPILTSGAMLGLCCGAALATEVTVVSSRGSVNITQGEHLIAVSASTRVTLPAQIKTGVDGMLDLKDGDSLVHIGPNSTVALPDAGKAGSLVDHYLQSAGSALYNIQSRHGRPMSVETPYLVSVVKGTVFTISVEDGASSVTLMEGSLDVSAPGGRQHVLLKPNQSIRHAVGDGSLVVTPAGTPPASLKGATAEAATPAGDEVTADQFALVTRDLAQVGASVSAHHALLTASSPPVGPMATVAATRGAGKSNTTSSNGAGSGVPPAAVAGNSATTGTTPAATGSPTVATSPTSANNPGTSNTVGTTTSGTNGAAPGTPVAGAAGSSQSTAGNGAPPGGSASAGGSPESSGSPTTTGSTGTPAASSTGSSSSSSSAGTNSGSSGSTGSASAPAAPIGPAPPGPPAAPPAPAPPTAPVDPTPPTPPVVGCNGKTNGTGLGQCLGHKPKT